MTMTDSQSFLAAIQAAPDDDHPRGLFADWLEWDAPAELRDPERAEFIRAQLELAEKDRWDDAEPKRRLTDCILFDKRGYDLVVRLHEFRAIEERWVDTNRRALREHYGCNVTLVEGEVGADDDAVAWLSRGFIAGVTCTESLWMGTRCNKCTGHPGRVSVNQSATKRCPGCLGAGYVHGIGPRLAQENPIERVLMPEKMPLGQVNVWMLGDASCTTGPDEARLANEVFLLLEGGLEVSPGVLGFPTQKAALDAMSQAYIAWAKKAAIVLSPQNRECGC